MALLEVEDLRVHFHTDDGVVRAVDGVSYSLDAGETLGIVGESGSGKSVGTMALMRLLPEPPARIHGSIRFDGEDVLALPKRRMREIRGNKIAMIFQDPMTCLNPFLKISTQIIEAIELHTDLRGSQARDRASRFARTRRHPRRGGTARPVPAPVQRRHAPARDDRHGARVRAATC